MKIVWEGYNRTDINLEAVIIQEPEFYTLYCTDVDADEDFAIMKCKDIRILQENAARFLELEIT